MNKESLIYVAGHNGMVGSSIVRELNKRGYINLLLKSHKELDLTNQSETLNFFESENPDYVFMAAAKVGGIVANNKYKANFIYENIMIQSNIIHSSYLTGVKKLLFLGSSCIYPKNSIQPIKEKYLLDGKLEPTNEPYAIAKIAGIKMCEAYKMQHGCNFISVMPCNLYGPGDNYDLSNSHVLPALLRKISNAKNNNINSVEIWGTGNPLREFLYVDDLSEACVFLMENYDGDLINIGYGEEISIKNLAEIIKNIVNYDGELIFNTDNPDGTYRKLMDISKIKSLGWTPKTKLEDGIKNIYYKNI